MGEDNRPTLSTYQLAALAQKQKELKQKNYQEESKRRLNTIITKKIRTSFIGAIAACEEGLGFLWGHGKPDDERTSEEKAMDEIWQVVRANILDNGNGQLRGAINEINIHTISWDKYRMDLTVKPLKEDNTDG